MFESKTTAADNELKALVRDAQALFDEATAAGGAKALTRWSSTGITRSDIAPSGHGGRSLHGCHTQRAPSTSRQTPLIKLASSLAR